MRTLEARAAVRSRLADYLELTKPRVTSTVLITALAGFYMGAEGAIALGPLLHCLLGTALVAGGASALNEYLERERDARMRRTRSRPLPEGRLGEADALRFAVAIAVGGSLYLGVFANPLTGVLAALTVFLYVFVYTPLKPRTGWATLVGAVPGAAPPVLGWTAAGGSLDAMAGALFLIVFLWQLPHFLAIAWIYDEDYLRGGFIPLTIRHNGEESAVRQIVFYAALLIPVSLLPTVLGAAGALHLVGALLAGCGYLGAGLAVAFARSPAAARRLLKASVLYLPVVFFLMVIDKVR